MNTCHEFREEFRLSKLCLQHKKPSWFVKPQCFNHKVHVIWTGFWMLFYVSTLSLECYYSSWMNGKWFVFLTNWCYLIQALLVFYDFAVSVYANYKNTAIKDDCVGVSKCYMGLLWVIFNVNNTLSMLVTLLYFALLQPEMRHSSINKHVLNTVYTILNLLFCAKPVQLLHVYQPAILGGIYIVFSVVYQRVSREVIYTPLDWDKPTKAVLISLLAVFVGIPLLHCVVYALYTLRLYISSKLGCTSTTFHHENINVDNNTVCPEQNDQIVELESARDTENQLNQTSHDHTKF